MRRDVEGTREEIYSDLYCRSDIHEGGKLKVNYLCCISGCTKPVVSMFVTSSGSVVFQNFSKHLAVHHEEYLYEADRSFSMQSTQPTVGQYFSTQQVAPSTQPANPSNRQVVPHVSRLQKSQDAALRENLLRAIVKVIAHGPYPISMLKNPAIEDFLKEIKVVSESFKFPSRQTVTRRLDEFLDDEGKAQNNDITQLLDFFCLGWDEWTSKQNLNYMALNVTGIPDDFSRLVDFVVAVSLFPYPHEMKDIRLKVMSLTQLLIPEARDEPVSEDGVLQEQFVKKVFSLTYDGAAANYAFSPSDQVAGILAAERALRREICAKYEKIEERRCICHRLVLILQHTYDDRGNDASNLFKLNVDRIYAFFDIIHCSQKNVQELRRVQEIDVDRVGAVVGDITVPKTRWNYNSRRMSRCQYLYKYASVMESKTAETAEAKREWSVKNIDCGEGLTVLKYVIPIIERVQTWVTYLQNSTTPTISLLLYIMNDLVFVCDDLANKADLEGNQDAEIILSRILAELRAEFSHDFDDDYLKLAQLLDPRVCHRTGSTTEVDRLLALAVKTYIPECNSAAGVNDDIFAESQTTDCSHEVATFKSHLRKVKKVVGADTEFWGGVERQQDIDVFSFYQAVASTIPSILVVIRKILSDMSATATNERVFNVAGNVLNIRRCRLAPARAEKLILSAFRFRCNARASKAPPFLPSFGIIDVRDNPDDAIDEQVEQERLDDDAAAWEAFFEE